MVRQFQGDTPSALGSQFDELMRHVSPLRNDSMEMVRKILCTLCKIGGQTQNSPAQQEVRCIMLAAHTSKVRVTFTVEGGFVDVFQVFNPGMFS